MSEKNPAFIRETYVDGVEVINMINGTVRLDLFSLQPPRDGQGQPEPQTRGRLIMPLPSFLNTYDAMGRIVNKLVEDGIITRRENADSAEN